MAMTPSIPPPPLLRHPAAIPPQLIAQGAEGILYRATFLTPSLPAALKYRASKPYRHPLLDARLTRHRILAEARLLARCRRDGVAVPAVYCVDAVSGWLLMEWVEGAPVRVGVDAWLADKSADAVADAARNGELCALLRRVGAAVARLHAAGVVHGDLTTSNMMLRPTRHPDHAIDLDPAREEASLLAGEVVMIDFGLASTSSQEEDRAVDLYVLERAFLSTHPRAEMLFTEVVDGYRMAFKPSKPVLQKLEHVRMRGRKRDMVG